MGAVPDFAASAVELAAAVDALAAAAAGDATEALVATGAAAAGAEVSASSITIRRDMVLSGGRESNAECAVHEQMAKHAQQCSKHNSCVITSAPQGLMLLQALAPAAAAEWVATVLEPRTQSLRWCALEHSLSDCTEYE